jgi:hypothetical protein
MRYSGSIEEFDKNINKRGTPRNTPARPNSNRDED